MPGYPEFGRPLMPTTEAIQKLRYLEDDTLSYNVNEFAHFLSERLGTRTNAEHFALTAVHAVMELGQGRDEETQEPLESELAFIDARERGELQHEIPLLAHAVFDANFAFAVQASLIRIGEFTIIGENPVDLRYYKEEITKPISTASEAYLQIIQNAKQHVLLLDWGYFGLTRDEVAAHFDDVFMAALNESRESITIPIAGINDTIGQHTQYISTIAADKKVRVSDTLWLVLDAESISEDLATFIKDALLIESIDAIAKYSGPSTPSVLEHFRQVPDDFFLRAAQRWRKILKENPHFINSD